ncbi:MAG: patatin-like phospholipase family protein [Anaerolineae bacterium]|jgi:predicted acylesterase/phospholipase RssA|nr:patatin-like phospholipase family protein [Anaerolineae bacterium]
MRREIPQLHKQPGTALVLSGGATKAFYFHLGVLRVLGVQDISSIVGTSAGAIAGALIASGATVETIIAALEEKEVYVPRYEGYIRFVGSRLMFKPSAKYIAAQGLQTGFTALRFLAALPLMLNQDVVAEALDRLFLSQRCAPGFFSASEIEGLFRKVLPSNDFADLDIDLYVTATALDTHERAVFNGQYHFEDKGTHFMNDVPVHKAVRASTSLPGMFEPVKIKDKYYIDGEVKRSLSMDVGIALADRVVVSHTYQPLLQTTGRSIHDMGWLNIFKQSIHMVLHERIAIWRDLYAQEYPTKEVVWIEPDPEDMDFFLAPEFSFRPEVQKLIIRSGELAARQALERLAIKEG